jgi:beta-glucanase (GH16 family)
VIIVGAVLLLSASSCDGGGTVQAVPDWGGGERSPYIPEGYELTFSDEFERRDADTLFHPVSTNASSGKRSDQPDESRTWKTFFTGWNVRHLQGNDDKALKAGPDYRGRGELSLGEWGIQLHEMTEDGTLKLYARQTPPQLRQQFDDFPYLGGMISGQDLHAQTYGYWEMRVRLNTVSAGHHWAFWLIPDDNAWPPEIDMLEAVGSNPENQSDADYFFFNSILTDPNTDSYTRINPPRGKNAWYTVGFLWTETDMRWFLDGQEVRHRPAMGDDKALYFLVSPEVGGKWVGTPTAETEWPMEAEIDYIKVYQQK